MSATAERFVVAGSRPWNREVFERRLRHLEGMWEFVATDAELTDTLSREPEPSFVFFLHWSTIVPAEIHDRFRCVVFHMTDVPYGRGGSPLQNLIVRGHAETTLTALLMTGELDGGPVYAKAPLSLAGTAEEVYTRAGELSGDLVEHIVRTGPEPAPQRGPVTRFRRRTPLQSEIPPDARSPASVYDWIRMLDADGYPHAFIRHGTLHVEFRSATVDGDEVVATARIRVTPPEENA